MTIDEIAKKFKLEGECLTWEDPKIILTRDGVFHFEDGTTITRRRVFNLVWMWYNIR